MTLAPIALFAFRRPEHLRKTIEALKICPEFSASPVYVYCDGPRTATDRISVTAVRNVARAMLDGFHVTMVESAENRGLANSIISGVGDLCEKHGRVIVVEDDLLVSPGFLAYMNVALRQFAGNEQVMQVAGHAFLADRPGQRSRNAFFLPFVSSWGWATWQRAWAHFDKCAAGWERLMVDPAMRARFDLDGAYAYTGLLKKQMEGSIDSWAIRWYWSVFRANGLVLYPPESMVTNIGFDGSGSHGRWKSKAWRHVDSSAAIRPVLPQIIQVNEEEFALARKAIRGSLLARVASSAKQRMDRWRSNPRILPGGNGRTES